MDKFLGPCGNINCEGEFVCGEGINCPYEIHCPKSCSGHCGSLRCPNGEWPPGDPYPEEWADVFSSTNGNYSQEWANNLLQLERDDLQWRKKRMELDNHQNPDEFLYGTICTPKPAKREVLSILTILSSPSTLNPQPSTPNPQPSTLNPQPSTLNPQPSTLNPQL
jgi:hypothetical protein